jgi:hypothetical protein
MLDRLRELALVRMGVILCQDLGIGPVVFGLEMVPEAHGSMTSVFLARRL